MNSFEKYLDVLPEIQQALDENKPVVALESTILSHGMPYPENLDFAHRVEDVIRSLGAVPATCAIVKGRLKVGLTAEELAPLVDPAKFTGMAVSQTDTFLRTQAAPVLEKYRDLLGCEASVSV